MCVGRVASNIVSCTIVYILSSIGSRLSNILLAGGSSVCIPFSMSSGIVVSLPAVSLMGVAGAGCLVSGASHAFRPPVVCRARPVCP